MPTKSDLLSPSDARILICDELHPAALASFGERGLEPEVVTGLSEAELIQRVPGYHALIVRSATKITRPVLEAADALRVVGRAGVGVDNVDCEAATERGVVVMNTPTGNTTTTGELAIALICALSRHLGRADRRVQAGQWGKQGLTGTELTGKQLGVVGLGRIGRVVAERGLGLKMKVVAHDPYLSAGDGVSPVKGVELMELDELLASSDFVSLHVPLLDSTRNLLSAERIALMKPGARLINAARGGLVDEAALLEALESGRLAGAALDVLAEEPPGPGHPLVGREDVIITPHLGASSEEAQRKVAVDIAAQVADFLTEGVAHNSVNAPAVDAETLKELAPYFILAERMGSFLAQRSDEPVRKLEVSVSGEIARFDTSFLSLSVLLGLLRVHELGVNRVNATLIAKERGVRILESSEQEAGAYQSQIKVRASAKGGGTSHLVTGTVFGRSPRFVRIDDLHLDLAPEGPLLVTHHNDEPGVVGRIGTELGSSRLNIRRVELGAAAHHAKGWATGFFSLDARPDAELLERLSAIDAIQELRLIEL